MSDYFLKIEDLSVSYENKRVLSNIYLNIEQGHRYALIGPNGAGKSTMIKAILGLIPINNGSILMNDQPIDLQRKKIAYVPQKNEVDWQFPANVYDIVLMGRYPFKKIFSRLNSEDYDMAYQAMKDLDIIQLKNRQIGELSGGQQQRVFIARALCQQPDLYLLDEPYVGVDIPTEERIAALLEKLSEQKKTILIVHHDIATAPEYFDKVILINQRLIAYGDLYSTLTKENIEHTYKAQLSLLNRIGQFD